MSLTPFKQSHSAVTIYPEKYIVSLTASLKMKFILNATKYRARD